MLADYYWCDDALTPHQQGERGGGWLVVGQTEKKALAGLMF